MSIFRNKYVYIKSDNGEDAGNILQTSPPYIIGRVLKFKKDDDFVAFLTKQKSVPISRIDGYKIAIQFFGGFELADNAKAEDSQSIIREMSSFYYINRILPKQDSFNRYKIDKP